VLFVTTRCCNLISKIFCSLESLQLFYPAISSGANSRVAPRCIEPVIDTQTTRKLKASDLEGAKLRDSVALQRDEDASARRQVDGLTARVDDLKGELQRTENELAAANEQLHTLLKVQDRANIAEVCFPSFRLRCDSQVRNDFSASDS
jgi:septal ring factor EnvC (AmiA/AmiB activator)